MADIVDKSWEYNVGSRSGETAREKASMAGS